MANSLRPAIAPELVSFAFVRGEPAAVCGTLPDLYETVRPVWRWPADCEWVRLARLTLLRRRVQGLRLWFFGVRDPFRGMHLDAVLFSRQKKYALAHGYRTVEASSMLEDNVHILHKCELLGLRHYKTWRVYDLDV